MLVPRANSLPRSIPTTACQGAMESTIRSYLQFYQIDVAIYPVVCQPRHETLCGMQPPIERNIAFPLHFQSFNLSIPSQELEPSVNPARFRSL